MPGERQNHQDDITVNFIGGGMKQGSRAADAERQAAEHDRLQKLAFGGQPAAEPDTSSVAPRTWTVEPDAELEAQQNHTRYVDPSQGPAASRYGGAVITLSADDITKIRKPTPASSAVPSTKSADVSSTPLPTETAGPTKNAVLPENLTDGTDTGATNGLSDGSLPEPRTPNKFFSAVVGYFSGDNTKDDTSTVILKDDEPNNGGSSMTQMNTEAGNTVALRTEVTPVIGVGQSMDPSQWTVAPWTTPRQHIEDKRFKDLAVYWDKEVSKDIALGKANGVDVDRDTHKPVGLIPVNQYQRETGERAGVLAGDKLPPAIFDSPAAFPIKQAVIRRAISIFEVTVEDSLKSLPVHPLPNANILAQNNVVTQLGKDAIEAALDNTFYNMSPLEAQQRVANSLSGSTSPYANEPLEVVTNSSNATATVDAWHVAHLIEAESEPGGLLGGRSDAISEITRPNGVTERVFDSSVFTIQDRDDPKITYVAAVQPHSMPMPGMPVQTRDSIEGVDEVPQNWGTLQLSAVAVNAERFATQMDSYLNQPQQAEVTLENNQRVFHEVRSRVDMAASLESTIMNHAGILRPVLRFEDGKPQAIGS